MKEAESQKRKEYADKLANMTLKTFKDVPDEVKPFKLLLCTDDRFSIEWETPISNNGVLTKFTIYFKERDAVEYTVNAEVEAF